MSMPSGTYLITNLTRNSLVTLPKDTHGTAVASSYLEVAKETNSQLWEVRRCSDNRYEIRSFATKLFAGSRSRPTAGDEVCGVSHGQQWVIRDTAINDVYTITTGGLNELGWMLGDPNIDKPVTLDPRLNDPRFFWRFETASAGPPSTVSEANVSGAIILRDAYGRYLSVTSTDRLKFEATRADRALFFVEKTSEGRVVLKGSNGKYVNVYSDLRKVRCDAPLGSGLAVGVSHRRDGAICLTISEYPGQTEQTLFLSSRAETPAQDGSLVVSFVEDDTCRFAVENIPTSGPQNDPSPAPYNGLLSGIPALAVLCEYDTVIVVDDSASMLWENRWQETKIALGTLAEIVSQLDTDGITICFLNSDVIKNNVTDSRQVMEAFEEVRPSGATPLGSRLDQLLREYTRKLKTARAVGVPKNVKPINYLVITDGEPSDDPVDVIKRFAKEFDDGKYPLKQVGIQFVQVGGDEDAAEYLRELDDGLELQFSRDMVDTTPFVEGEHLNAPMLTKILLGGINRRVDRLSNEKAT